MPDVTGGEGGVSAELEDMRTQAKLLDASGDGLRDAAGAVTGLGDTALLLASAPFGPATAFRAQAALAEASARLLALSLRVEAQSDVLRLTADATELADTGSRALRSVFDEVVGTYLVLEAGKATAVAAAVGAVGGAAGWARERLDLFDPTPEDPEFWDAVRGGAGDAVGELWDVDRLTALLDAHPHLYHLLLDGTENVLTGLDLATGGLATDDHGLYFDRQEIARFLLSFATEMGGGDTEVSVVGLDGAAGLPFADDIDVPPGQAFDGLASFVANLQFVEDEARHDNRAGADDYSLLAITRIDSPDGPHFIVQVPGTQQWDPGPGGDPSDLTTNLAGFADGDAASLRAIADALRQAGVPADAPILVSGHSQGGILAASFAAQAADHGFHVTHVVTAGSPISHVPIPDHVQALSLEHADDPVPNLNGPNADRPNHTTVVADAEAPHALGPAGPHDRPFYVDTAEAAEAGGHASVDAWLESADGFMGAGETDWFYSTRHPLPTR